MIPAALTLRACLRKGVGPQVGEVTRLSEHEDPQDLETGEVGHLK